jgi:GT2 family glycosyltransferase
MNDAPLVSIIVVTYGTGPIVLEMLDAVARSTPVEHEVIVVDCLPADPATRTSRLLGDRSDIRLFAVDDNLGFAGGNEYGVEHARGEYLCFLNPDVIVGPGWLEPLIAALDDPAVGIAAPVFLNEDGSLQEAGQLVFSDTFTTPVGGPDVMAGDPTNIFSRDVDYASAACWVVRRCDHDAIGGFDRRYHPAYFEDADYALRMEATGRRTRLVADVPVVHRRGQGTGNRTATLGQVTHARFKRQWEDHLSDRPSRPTTGSDAIAARDRLAGETTLFVAWSDRSSVAERTTAFERAQSAAQGAPRDRVTLLTDVPPSSADDDRARTAGLEVVVASGDRSGLEAERSAMADEVVHIGTPAPTVERRSPGTWLAVAAVFLVGVVIRWLLFDTPAAVINADEAYTRIETFEILRGQFPIALGGTVYTLPGRGLPVHAVHLPVQRSERRTAQAAEHALLARRGGHGVLHRPTAREPSCRIDRRGDCAGSHRERCWCCRSRPTPHTRPGCWSTTLAFLVATMILDTPTPGPSRRMLVLFGALAGFAFWLHPMFFTVMVPDGSSRPVDRAAPRRRRG